MSDYPRFTVIIPQKNRAEYLIHTLKTCMIQDYPKFEVIVSDDCSDDNSVEIALNLAKQDARIKVFPHKVHLGMRDNFEFALNQVKPGYVLALGGDDALTPNCIWRMYELLKETKRDLLAWKTAGFVYPTDNETSNIFSVPRKKLSKYRIIKSSWYLNKISKTFRYQIDESPMFYVKGVASTELVNRVKSRTKDKSFYYCPTPDGFSGVVLAGEVEDYVYTDEPLTIMGTTIKSQGANYRRTDAQSKREAEQFFNDNIRRTMHSKLASQPYSPIVTLMTADYLLTAMDLPGWPGKFDPFTIEDLIINTFKFLHESFFESDVLHREMEILKQIAMQHDLMHLYNEQLQKSKKIATKNKNIYGFAITNSYRFDGSEIGINNIYDAALATNFIYNFGNLLSLKYLLNGCRNSLKIVMQKFNRKYESFPINKL